MPFQLVSKSTTLNDDEQPYRALLHRIMHLSELTV